MQCPQCHTTMENGYIPTGGGINWFRHREAGLFPFAVALPGTSSWFRKAKLEAYRCVRCELVVIRYGKQVDDTHGFKHR